MKKFISKYINQFNSLKDAPFYLAVMLIFSLLFFITHFTNDILSRGLPMPWEGALSTGKACVFISLSAFLVLVIAPSLGRCYGKSPGRAVLDTLVLFLMLCFLFGPRGFFAMGMDYAAMSNNPFGQTQGVFNKRILMPAIGWLFKLRGNPNYLLLNFGLVFHLILLMNLYLDGAGKGFRLWQRASLATSGFIAFQFGYPGYPDPLLFNLLALFCLFPMDDRVRLILYGLALLTHEAAIFVCLPFAFFFASRKLFVSSTLLTSLYGLFLAISFGFRPSGLMTHHIAGDYAFILSLARPGHVIAGLFFSFKALWVILLIGLIQGNIRKRPGFYRYAASFAVPLVPLFALANDTSRMAGFVFPVFLMAIAKWVFEVRGPMKRITNWVFLLNMLIPFMHIHLNSSHLNLNYKWIPAHMRTMEIPKDW